MYNRVSQKLMAKMGFREGEGLGKFGQGRKEIVETSTQRGRRGLGLTLKGFQGDLNVDWQDEPEPSALESVTWFPESSPEIPDADELKDWMTMGQKKLKIDDETEFCSENLLHLLLRCKTVFDNLEGEEMRRARTRSNPYETIRGAFFLNRAAMKMANMDHVFDYMFTNPKDFQGKPQTRDKDGELLYFGDVCAGPGGFSEYVLWRRHWHAKGFGMTLKGANDFKLEDFYAAPSELFEAYYGMATGTVLVKEGRPRKISERRRMVRMVTDHLQRAPRTSCCRWCRCTSFHSPAYFVQRGHFVCKTFDLFTPFSVGLIYLLYLCFERVSLFKPVTSRPANSERYVVCKSLKPGTDAVREYMFTINLKLNQFRHSDRDVTEVVPLDIIKGDTDFFQFMINSNESITNNAVCLCRTLFEPRQADIRKECLKLWGVSPKTITTSFILLLIRVYHQNARIFFGCRIQMAEKFVKAVSKPSRPDMNPIRVKEVYRLEEMEKIFVRLEMKVTKSSGGMPRLSYTGRDDRHFLPSGLYIIKTVNDPWTMAFSKSSKRKFFYNKQTKESTYALPPGSVAPFHACHQDRLFWAWEEGVRVHDSQTRVNPDKLSKDDVLSFIHQHCQQ
uniref:Cap-specific mRNA (nucleoside-2'-O-)-methyltransferase 1 n=1 Tax=Sinocyclocheilus grahami TaxID=75366 RepID=A0A672N881_SINGR